MSTADKRPAGADKIQVRPASSADKPVRRAFPGPRQASSPLRVAIDRAAYAELIAHAKSSLDAEVCGVLVGQICEDDTGPFVHVEALISGQAAAQAATHVTFTQATWDAIHRTLERDHPKRRIVGWYHTHPGFGVEFSEMDLFIQRNFFPGPTQIALVTDPMNGAVAIIANIGGDIAYLSRFWVDGREQSGVCPAPAAQNASTSSASTAPASGGVANTSSHSPAFQALEARIGQLIQANDELRSLFHRVLLGTGLAACMGIITVTGYFVYRQYTAPLEPPEVNSYVPIPVRIGDKNVLLGVGVVQWHVPDELNALMIEHAERERLRAAEAAAAKDSAGAPAAETAPSAEAGATASKPSAPSTP